MDTRLLAVWLMLCQFWAVYTPCSTMANPWVTASDAHPVFDEDSSSAEGNSAETSPSTTPDSTTEGISSLAERQGRSGDTSNGHRRGICCQNGYGRRGHHGRMMGQDNEYGHMMGRRNGHMMGQHYRQMGSWSNRMHYNDRMQDIPADGSKEADRDGSVEQGYQGMMGNGQPDMMRDHYEMSNGVDNNHGDRHRRRHRRRNGRFIPDQNQDD